MFIYMAGNLAFSLDGVSKPEPFYCGPSVDQLAIVLAEFFSNQAKNDDPYNLQKAYNSIASLFYYRGLDDGFRLERNDKTGEYTIIRESKLGDNIPVCIPALEEILNVLKSNGEKAFTSDYNSNSNSKAILYDNRSAMLAYEGEAIPFYCGPDIDNVAKTLISCATGYLTMQYAYTFLLKCYYAYGLSDDVGMCTFLDDGKMCVNKSDCFTNTNIIPIELENAMRDIKTHVNENL